MATAREPKAVKSQLHTDAYNASKATELSRGAKGAIIGHLNDAFGGDQARKLALAWLFDALGRVVPSDPDTYITGLSTKSLSNGDWWALYLWIGFYKDDSGEWKTRPEFPLEASLVLAEAMRAYMKLPVDRKKEDQSFVADMVAHAVTNLGAVITNVQNEDGTWKDNTGVELPKTEPKTQRILPQVPDVDF